MESATTSKVSGSPQCDVKKVFDMFDRDHNGTICAAEFSTLVHATGVDVTQTEITNVMKKFDKNEDGVIDFNEFVIMMQEFEPRKKEAIQENLRQAFRKFDCDNSGFISPEELRYVVCNTGEKLTLEEAEELISMFDTNKDGQLSYEEFLEFYNNAMEN